MSLDLQTLAGVLVRGRELVSLLRAPTLRAVLAAIKGEQLGNLKPGMLTSGSFYREACKYFARAHQGLRKRSA